MEHTPPRLLPRILNTVILLIVPTSQCLDTAFMHSTTWLMPIREIIPAYFDIRNKIINTRGSTKVTPPIFSRNYNCNNKEIYMDDAYIFCNNEAILSQSPSFLTRFCQS